jgi:hypothetical protein
MTARRERPDDGGVVWHARANAFECLGCGEMLAFGDRRIWGNPERLAEVKELVVKDHEECWLYQDAEKARQARRYRKERKRRERLVTRAARALGETGRAGGGGVWA